MNSRLKRLISGSFGFEWVIQRHGHAARADIDFERQLSSKGDRQANAAEDELEKTGLHVSHLVLSSTAQRAVKTFRGGISGSRPEVVTRSELYIPQNTFDAARLNGAFDRIGYAPLRDYLRSEAASALVRWALEAIEVIHEETTKTERIPDQLWFRVRIQNHAVMGPMLAVMLHAAQCGIATDGDSQEAYVGRLLASDDEGIRKILDCNLGEACAIVLRGSSVRFIEIPPVE